MIQYLFPKSLHIILEMIFDVIFKTIDFVRTFLHQSDEEATEKMGILFRSHGLFQVIQQYCLAKFIPKLSKQLVEYQEVIKETVKFEEKLRSIGCDRIYLLSTHFIFKEL